MVKHLTDWCKEHNLVLNTSKTKELIVYFRRTKKEVHLPLHIHREAVESVEDLRFLGVNISNKLTWTSNTSNLVKKAQQRLFFLRKLRQARLPQKLLVNFYRSTIESTVTSCITVWYTSCTAAERKDLQRVV